MNTTNPYDIAYLAGFDDGTQTVASLTLRLTAAYVVIGFLTLVIIYLGGIRT